MATTPEVYDELIHLTGVVGDCIRANQPQLVLELGQPSWDYLSYIAHSRRMLVEHRPFISEFCGGSRKTVCVNDISIVALGKTLSLPVVSSETRCSYQTTTKRHIPDVCDIEGVLHMTFNDFLRAEGIQT